MKEIEQGARQPDAWQAWQQALAEVPATPALSGALLPRWDDLFGRFVAWYGRLRSRPRAERRRWQRQLGLSLAGIALLLAVNGAPAGAVGPAATITVSGPCDLIEAIGNANDTTTGQPNTDCDAGNPAGADTIDLQVNVVLTASNNSTYGPTGLPAITSAITIQGNGKTISRSSATDFRILAVAVGGNLTLNSATVSGGVASGASPAFFGGGIYNRGALTVQNSTLSGNSAGSNTGGGGGGIFNRGGGTLTVQNSILSGNSANAGGGGGGIDNRGTLTVQSSTLSGNSTSRGGGIRNYFGSTATVSNSTFSGNSAFNGGGIANNSASLAISNSTFSGNSASRGGGIDNRGTLTVQNSTLSGNSAFNGGGIYSGGFLSTVAVMNSTLSGNSAFNGGGIYSGGILSTVAVMNSIVAAQTGGADCSADGTFNSGGYNIESATSCNFIQASDLRNVTSASLALQPLANNGGPTQTQALGLTSVAVDRIPVGALEANGCVAGTSTDQRNAPRAEAQATAARHAT